MDPLFVRLTGFTEEKIDVLSSAGISTVEDLLFYEGSDFIELFPNSNRRVSHIIKTLPEISGRAAWVALEEWFRSDSVKDDLILKYQIKAESLELNE